MSVTFPDGLLVRGGLVVDQFDAPALSVNSDAIKVGANLKADKLETRGYCPYSQPDTAAASETRSVLVAKRTGTVKTFSVGSIAPAVGDSTVTVDLRKNGTTVLTAVVTLNNANTARVAVLGSIGVAGTFVAGDWFEVVVVATIGTGTLPTGLFAQMEFDQNGA